jgi:hypothetical protein
MCFKLDNGSELFSVQDMQKLKKSASGRMGSKNWVEVSSPAAKDDKDAGHGCSCGGNCGCGGKCVTCKCAELRALRVPEAGHGSDAFGHPEG